MSALKNWIIKREPLPGDPRLHETAVGVMSRGSPRFCPDCGADLRVALFHQVMEVDDDDDLDDDEGKPS